MATKRPADCPPGVPPIDAPPGVPPVDAPPGVPPVPKKAKTDKEVDSDFFAYVDGHQEEYVKRLAEFVSIPGVSMDPQRRPDVVRSVQWVEAWCKKLGAATKLEDIGNQTLPDGSSLALPPVLLAQFGNDLSKRTLVVYGHLDVQPASKSDGWSTEPFTLTEVDGALYGRGSTDDKGPVCAWLWVIEAYKALGRELPVNLRCVFEGMEESGSVGLPELVRRLGASGDYLDPEACDYICVSDNYWVGKSKPCLSNGLRGNCYFHLDVECSTKDMHSGVIGGSVHEAMTDLVKIMSTLVDSKGKILIDGIHDDIAPITESDRQAYRDMDFDVEEYKKDVGVDTVHNTLLHATKEDTLIHRWVWPTLSLHGIEGAFDGAGSKTVIPAKVKGKFSIRIVPNMNIKKVEEVVTRHVNAEWVKLGSPNKMKLELTKAGLHWHRNPNDPNFRAAAAATKRVHGVEPQMTREGGSIPIVEVLEEAASATCVLLPIGASDDGAHSQNEKLNRKNYFDGIKILQCYLEELANLPPELDAAAKAAVADSAARRMASNKWRKSCKINLMRFGCECLECQ